MGTFPKMLDVSNESLSTHQPIIHIFSIVHAVLTSAGWMLTIAGDKDQLLVIILFNVISGVA